MAAGKYGRDTFSDGLRLGMNESTDIHGVYTTVLDQGTPRPFALGAIAGAFEYRGTLQAAALAQILDIPITERMIKLWKRKRGRYIPSGPETEPLRPTSKKFWEGKW